MTRAGTSRASAGSSWTARDVAGPFTVVMLLFAGYVKANPAFAGMAVDLTLVAFAMTAVGIAGCVIGRMGSTPVPIGGIGLALTFVPGILLASGTPYSGEKVEKLVITATAALAAYLLIGTARRHAIFAAMVVGFGVVVAVGTLVSPAPESATIRVAIQGADTIATGRALGVAVVVLITAAVVQRRFRWPMVTLAGGLSYLLVGTGSRGPVLAVVAVVVLVVLLVPGVGRATRIMLVLVALAGLVLTVDESGLEGASRIRDTLAGRENASEGRFAIWHDALAAIATHPAGVGWGDFWTVLAPGARHTTTYVQYAHDIVLEAAVEGGWIAGAAVVLFIALSLRRMHSPRTPAQYSILAIAVFFVLNALVSGDLNDNRTMWAALALGWTAVWTPAGRNAEVVSREHPVFTPM